MYVSETKESVSLAISVDFSGWPICTQYDTSLQYLLSQVGCKKQIELARLDRSKTRIGKSRCTKHNLIFIEVLVLNTWRLEHTAATDMAMQKVVRRSWFRAPQDHPSLHRSDYLDISLQDRVQGQSGSKSVTWNMWLLVNMNASEPGSTTIPFSIYRAQLHFSIDSGGNPPNLFCTLLKYFCCIHIHSFTCASVLWRCALPLHTRTSGK